MRQIMQKYWLGILIALLVIVAGAMIYAKLHPNTLPDNLVQGTGRIDGDLINMNVKYPGRIIRLGVEEGQAVHKDEVIAVLRSDEQEAQKAQIQSQIEAQTLQLSARKIELEMARKTVPQTLVKADANLIIKERQRDELDQMINAQKNLVTQDERDIERIENLYADRLIEKHQLEIAALKLQSDKDQYESLAHKREQLDQAIAISRSDRSDASAAQAKISAMEEGIKALQSGIDALEASKSQVDAVLTEMQLRSPVTGHVVEKIANEGEVIGSGMSVVTLIDPSSLYLKIFVDTLQNGKIKVGDSAVIFLDADPDKPINAKVVRVEQKAEFTPKEVSVASDRIQRVFAVHLKPISPDSRLKMGLPAVGVVSLDGKGLPSSLRRLPE